MKKAAVEWNRPTDAGFSLEYCCTVILLLTEKAGEQDTR